MEETSSRPIPVEVPDNDMVCEIDDFVRAVSGDKDALAARDRFERVTLASLSVMDEIRRQAGVVFPADLKG